MNTDLGNDSYKLLLKIESDLCFSVKICVLFLNSELRLLDLFRCKQEHIYCIQDLG